MSASKIARFSKKKREIFLQALSETGIVSTACSAAGIVRATAYKHKSEDVKFEAEWEDALESAVDAMEVEAHRRAVTGCLEPVFYQGEEVGHIRRYSDTLLMFLMKSRKPEKFRDNHSVELTGKDGAPINDCSAKERLIDMLDRLSDRMDNAQNTGEEK
ncbi:MAG: terminase [Armatimonadota bacterium]